MQGRKLLTLGGVAVFGLAALVVALLPSTPGADASGSSIASFYAAHQGRGVAVVVAIGLIAPCLIGFAVALAGARRPEGESRTASELVLLGGSVLAAGAFLLTAAVQMALADVPDKLSGDALQALNVLSNDTWAAWNPALGVMMLGAAATLRGRSGLRLLGTTAAVLGVALFIPFADFFALLATGLWLVAASVVLFRDTTTASYAARARTA